MTDAAIRIDRLQTFQITLHVAAQVAFDFEFIVGDRVNDLVQLLRSKVFGANVRIDVGLLKNAPRCAETRFRRCTSEIPRRVCLLEFQLLIVLA